MGSGHPIEQLLPSGCSLAGQFSGLWLILWAQLYRQVLPKYLIRFWQLLQTDSSGNWALIDHIMWCVQLDIMGGVGWSGSGVGWSGGGMGRGQWYSGGVGGESSLGGKWGGGG